MWCEKNRQIDNNNIVLTVNDGVLEIIDMIEEKFRNVLIKLN